jgi:hypothetical protein
MKSKQLDVATEGLMARSLLTKFDQEGHIPNPTAKAVKAADTLRTAMAKAAEELKAKREALLAALE